MSDYILHNGELYHYGVKGMKWGVRRFQKKGDDLILKKGTTVKRVSIDKNDRTYDNKKYVSINQEDHSKWEKYLGEGFRDAYGKDTYSIAYRTTKDLRVMSSAKQGKVFADMLLSDSEFADRAMMDMLDVDEKLATGVGSDYATIISRNIATQTETGRAFVQKALQMGYDGLQDTHGTNLAKLPLIVLNPDTNLERTGNPEYTSVSKENRKLKRTS